jgi:hypothetical protein
MKTNMKIQLILLCLFFKAPLYAQVTIGSLATPDPAVLLQINEYEPASGSGAATAGKGILLPRVKLTAPNMLNIANIAETDQDKKADLTGLLVYNVNASSGMEEGIYEWDGQEWAPLEILLEEDGAYTKKSLVRESKLTESNVPTVSIGRFSFRFSPDRKAQCKLNEAPSTATESVGFHLGRFWDEKNASKKDVGYAYDSKNFTFTPSNFGWQNFRNAPNESMNRDERWEIWLADAVKDKIYNVQFIIYTKVSIPTYIILVTEY